MADHFLAGPCEGISIHTNGCTASIRDIRGLETSSQTFLTEKAATEALWRWRDCLYRKYETVENKDAQR